MKQLFAWLKPHKKSLLLVTTSADNSTDLFVSPVINKSIDVTLARYSDTDVALGQLLGSQSFDFIYFRDPFNEGTHDLEVIANKIRLVVQQHPKARYIDHAKTIEDMLFEDKFVQYQLLQSFMPATELVQNSSQFVPEKNIIKKRISARSRDIAFNFDEAFTNGDYIIQPLLDIKTEYRVYAVQDKVIEKVSVRSSKQDDTKVKVTAVVDIPDNIKIFTRGLIERMPKFDLVGFDIAETTDGELVLIEANRSCQFTTFTKLSGINLAELLVNKLLG